MTRVFFSIYEEEVEGRRRSRRRRGRRMRRKKTLLHRQTPTYNLRSACMDRLTEEFIQFSWRVGVQIYIKNNRKPMQPSERWLSLFSFVRSWPLAKCITYTFVSTNKINLYISSTNFNSFVINISMYRIIVIISIILIN